jgi:hypothetical protein
MGKTVQEAEKTMNNFDFKKTVPVNLMRGDSAEDTALLREMLKEAETFLHSFSWCRSITESRFGLGVGGVVAVFLFKIVPVHADVDDWLWVVVGDLPPAYLVTDDNPNPASALEAYVAEMDAWVTAVESTQSVDDLIPVNVPATPENARQLRSRLEFLNSEIIPRYAD